MKPPAASVEPRGDGAKPARGGMSRRAVLGVAWAVAAAIAVIDYLSGTEIDVSLIWVFPVAWATWRSSRLAGGCLALFSALADTAVDVHLGRYRPLPLMIGWSVTVQAGLLLIATEGTYRLRRSLLGERSLAAGLNEAYGRLDDEVRRVAEIQSSLLPAAVPVVPGYRVAVHYEMCSRAGGDYYDFLPAPMGGQGFLIADVSGHGPSAAVIMAMARVIVHGEQDALGEPERALEIANRGLVANDIFGHFVTACYAVLDSVTGSFEFALAGHPRPVLARARSGDVIEIGSSDGPPLAVMPTTRYRRQAVVLEPGDLLVLYTDGLTEARDPREDLFGEERVLGCVAQARGLGAAAVVARLVDAMRTHLQGLPAQDDVTIVVLERLPGASTA